jgi:hypothetical protein
MEFKRAHTVFPDTQCEIQKQMWLYVRDDFMLWFRSQGRNPATNERLEFRIAVADAIEKMLKKMSVMSANNERKNVSAINLVRLFTDVGTLT